MGDAADQDLQMQMQEKGWEFVPISDNEWAWLKFDSNGKLIAQQGDETWQKDYEG